MHTSLFDDIQVEMAALYRLEKAKEELPLSEKPLLDISKYIKKNTSRGYNELTQFVRTVQKRP